MIEMGIIVGIGLLVTLVKMSFKWKLWMTSHPLFMDAWIFIALCLLHWGTFSGVMVATIGALTCSVVLSGARKVYGYMENGEYIRGFYDIASKV